MRTKKPARAGRRSGVRVRTNIRKNPDGTDVIRDYFETTGEETTVLGTESELQDTAHSYDINYTGVSLEPDTSNTNQYSLMTIKSPLRNPSAGKRLRGRKAGRPRKKSRSQKKRATAFPNSDSELLSPEKTYVDKSVITSPASFTRESLALSRVGMNRSANPLHLRSMNINSPSTSIPEKVELLTPRSISKLRIGLESSILEQFSRISSSHKSLSEEPLQSPDSTSSKSSLKKSTSSSSPAKSFSRKADKEPPYKLVEKVSSLAHQVISKSSPGLKNLESSKTGVTVTPTTKSLSNVELKNTENDKDISQSSFINSRKKSSGSVSPAKALSKRGNRKSANKSVEKSTSLTPKNTVSPAKTLSSNREKSANKSVEKAASLTLQKKVSPTKTLSAKRDKSANKSVEKSTSLTPKNTVTPAKTSSSNWGKSANKSVEKAASLTLQKKVSPTKTLSTKRGKSANKSVEKSISLTPKNTVSPAKTSSSNRGKSANKSVEKAAFLTPANNTSKSVTDLENLESSRTLRSGRIFTPTVKNISKSSLQNSKKKLKATISSAEGVNPESRDISIQGNGPEEYMMSPSLSNRISTSEVRNNNSSFNTKFRGITEQTSDDMSQMQIVTANKTLNTQTSNKLNFSILTPPHESIIKESELMVDYSMPESQSKIAGKSLDMDISQSGMKLVNTSMLHSSRNLQPTSSQTISNELDQEVVGDDNLDFEVLKKSHYSSPTKRKRDSSLRTEAYVDPEKSSGQPVLSSLNIDSRHSVSHGAQLVKPNETFFVNRSRFAIRADSSNRVDSTLNNSEKPTSPERVVREKEQLNDISLLQSQTRRSNALLDLGSSKSLLHSHRNICADDQPTASKTNSEDFVLNVTGKDDGNSKVLEESPSQVKRKRGSSPQLSESVHKRTSDDNVQPNERLFETSSQRKDTLSNPGTSGLNTSNHLTKPKKRGRKKGKSKDWNKTPSPTPYVRERPKRNRIPPLAYWKGEHRTFRFTKEGEIVLTETNLVNDPSMRMPSREKKPKAKKQKREDDVVSDQKQLFYYDEGSGSEVELLTVFQKLDWQMEKSSESNSSYKICKLELPQKHTTGYLELEMNGRREKKHSPVSNLQFVVLEGIVEFKVAGNIVKLGRRDSVFIPCGIHYSIKNCFERRSVLFFTSFLED